MAGGLGVDIQRRRTGDIGGGGFDLNSRHLAESQRLMSSGCNRCLMFQAVARERTSEGEKGQVNLPEAVGQVRGKAAEAVAVSGAT